jgi:hypothetical protein
MKANGGFAQLEWMLEYELLLADRNRRFVSMAMVTTDAPVGIESLLDGAIRDSDVFFQLSDNLGAVLMSDTDNSGAMTAIKRYKESSGSNGDTHIFVGLGYYPHDHLPASAFVSSVYDRMKKSEAQNQNAGVVVVED